MELQHGCAARAGRALSRDLVRPPCVTRPFPICGWGLGTRLASSLCATFNRLERGVATPDYAPAEAVFCGGGKKRPGHHCSRMRGIFRKISVKYSVSRTAKYRCTYPSNIQFPIKSSSLVHEYTISTSSTACLSQAGVYYHTYRETCVSSPVEQGTSLQKLTAAIISQAWHIQRLFKTELHSRSRQRSRSCSKTLRHS